MAHIAPEASCRAPVEPSTRLDLGARYETRVGNVKTTFILGIENVANRSYWAGAHSGIRTLAEPRTVKLTAKLDF